MINTRTNDVGRLGEKLAARFLKKQGYKILECNHRESHNEIDIIATDETYLVFAEVKTRTCDTDLYLPYSISPASAVTRQKQQRIIEAAERYLLKNPMVDKQPRLDVIEIYVSNKNKKLLKINHIVNAFEKTKRI